MVGLLAVCTGPSAWSDTWIDTHDAPETAWLLDTTEGARRLAQERVRVEGTRSGEEVGAERIAYVAPPGGGVSAWRIVPAATVIEELSISAEGRSPLPGVRLIAEVIAPGDPTEKRPPVRLRVRTDPANPGLKGDFALRLDNLPRRLEREARVWRVANRGKPLDTRNAYVARIGLALPGNGRPAQAWVRQLEMQTVVTPLRRTDAGLRAATLDEDTPNASTDPAKIAPIESLGGRVKPTRVTLRSDGFRVDGELYFPRVWRWRGEPIETLASRGVTTVWIDSLPTSQLLAEAAHHRLRVLCPPPRTKEELASVRSWDRVLAWVLPSLRDANDLDAGLVEIEETRALGPDAERPVLVHVEGGFEAWGRVADGLLVEARTSRVAPRPAEHRHRRLTSTPTFAVVPLDVGPRFAAQLDGLLGDGVATTWLPPSDISAAVHAALGSNSLGVTFTANERLDGADEATLAAAGWLETVNRRLRLIEPWIVGPRTQRPNPGSDGVLVLDRGGVRLLARDGLASSQRGGFGPVDEAARLYRMTPGGLTAWALPEAGRAPSLLTAAGDLLVCNDPRILRSLRGYTAQTGPAAATGLLKLAEQRLRETQALTVEDRPAVRGYLARARLALTRRDTAGAYDAAYAVLARVADAEQRRRTVARSELLQSHPLTVLPGVLTDYFRLEQLLAASPRGPNRLHGGSFEDIDALRRDGWRRPNDGNAGTGLVELTEGDSVHGERFLRLSGQTATDAAQITTPTLELTAGETFEITGWVRITESDPTGLLTIGDTLGGYELDLTIQQPSAEWHPFRLLRSTNSDTDLAVTIGTVGRITAGIDGVMIRVVEPLGVARRPARTALAPRAQAPRTQAK